MLPEKSAKFCHSAVIMLIIISIFTITIIIFFINIRELI